jgi:hypothetical protein
MDVLLCMFRILPELRVGHSFNLKKQRFLFDLIVTRPHSPRSGLRPNERYLDDQQADERDCPNGVFHYHKRYGTLSRWLPVQK